MVAAATSPAAVYRRLLGYLEPHWPLVAAAVVPAVVYGILGTAVPFIMREWIDGLQDLARNPSYAWQIPLFIVVLFPLRAVMDFVMVYGLAWVGRSVIRDLRGQLFGHYLCLPARYFDRGSSGLLISRLTYNTEQVAEAITNAIVIVLRDSVAIVALLVTMFAMSPKLTLLIGIVGPVMAVLVGAMSRAFRRYSSRIQHSMGDVTKLTEQSVHAHRVVKVFAGDEQERRQFLDVNTRNFRLHTRLVAVQAFGDGLTQYSIALGVAAVMYFSFADLNAAAFLGFITAMGMVFAPLKRLINVNVVVQRGIAAAASLFEILDQPGEADTGRRTVARARGDVAYRGVSFRYDEGAEPALRGIDLEVAAGSTVALVGQSGSGKTTLVSLLARFYEPSEGSVQLDGVDLRDYTLHDLRRQISLVSQDVVLFDDTIANNIGYGALSTCPRAAIERAAEAAYVTEFAAGLPAGLDTRVGERGALLSGGQRQRVAIARALLKDAPVLILDEATSALDAESERRVQEALMRLMKGRTTLVIAHRLSTVEKADRIVVMKSGEIVETGSHAELLARGGYYASLYRMQFAA